MSVDVVTEIDIQRARSEVAAFAADPANAPLWYENIKSADWEGPQGVAVGGRIRFTAHFLGRKLAYTYVIGEFVAGSRLVMATADGPFAMETTYEWSDAGDEATRMTLRNRGQPSGFARIAAGAMQRAIRRANEKDLQRLKALLEVGR
jgi:Polyketide cyclase / dehydrase and lipid transport